MRPVGEDDRLIGTISDRDLAICAVAEVKDAGTPIRDVMSESVAWAYEDDSVEEAAKIRSERQVRRLPVVDRNNSAARHHGAGRLCRREFGNSTRCPSAV